MHHSADPAVKFHGGAAVPDPPLFDQHRVGQPVPTAGEPARAWIRPPIPDVQPAARLSSARWAMHCRTGSAAVDEGQCHGRIVPCLFELRFWSCCC